MPSQSWIGHRTRPQRLLQGSLRSSCELRAETGIAAIVDNAEVLLVVPVAASGDRHDVVEARCVAAPAWGLVVEWLAAVVAVLGLAAEAQTQSVPSARAAWVWPEWALHRGLLCPAPVAPPPALSDRPAPDADPPPHDDSHPPTR